MPATGEAWRHYKGELYTIVGVGRDDNGIPTVIYTSYIGYGEWPLFTQPLGRFLQTLESHKSRFEHHLDAGTQECPYVRPPPRRGLA